MKLSKPPALATWLVEHVIPGGNNEALAGDLMEQFRQGRSVAWYWRQVVGAILVGWSAAFRILWTATGVTVFWTLTLSQFYGCFWVFAQVQAPLFWAMRHGWTLTRAFLIGSFVLYNALPLALTVGMYLGFTRVFSPRRFLRGLSAGLLAMALLHYMQSPKWLWHHEEMFVGHLVASLPVFFGLVVSMWAVRPNGAERGDVKSVLA